jgi:hypothetical protein
MASDTIPANTRKLGEQERLFHYLHGFGGLIAVQVLHISGRLDAELVQRGLAFLQAQHPIMRAHIRYGGLVFRSLPPFVYRQPWFELDGTTEIPLRVVTDPAPDAWERELQRELVKPMRRGRNPRLRAVLVRASANSELSHLLLTADHAVADAQASNMASRDLLAYFADPEAMAQREPVHTSLPAPLEAGMPKRPDSGTKGYTAALRLPAQNVPGGKQLGRLIERHLDAAETATLKQAIKANRTTTHGALSAAFLTAIREKYRLAEMTSISTVDLRRLCKPAFPTQTFGCYVDLLRTRHPITGSFWSIAQDVSFKLIAALAKDQETASIMKLFDWEVYRKESWPTLTHQRRIDGLAITTAGESGLAEHYGRFRLTGVSMAVSTVMFGSGLFVISSERLGCLDLFVCYADYALATPDAIDITDRALAGLRQAVVIPAAAA